MSHTNDAPRIDLNPPAHPPLTSEPIFVLGSVRSGTSAVFSCLQDGAKIPGYVEGHVTVLLQRVLSIAKETYGNYGNKSDRYLIGQLSLDGFSQYVTNYVAALLEKVYPSGRWVDKTPDDFPGAPAIRSAPAMLRMLPKARFVYCQRRGIENVLSRVKKFPQNPFWYHCRSWAETVHAWHEVKDSLGERCLAIEQHRLANQPVAVAAELSRFLGLSETEAEGLLHILTVRRVEQTRPAMEHRELGLDETGWDEGLINVFMTECGKAMELAGYSTEGRLIATDVGVRLFFPGHIEGQAETENVTAATFFVRGSSSFVLNPAPGGSDASVIYRGLPLNGMRTFEAQLRVDASKPTRIRFAVVVEDESGNRLLDEQVVVASTSEPVNWRVALRKVPLSICRVRISTKSMDGGSAPDLQACWVSPRFV